MNSFLPDWVFVLCITTTIVPASLSESIYNDLGTDTLDETGIIDISAKGRMDVRTNLNLSPWELFVLNDLIFKLTIQQCPKLDKDVMSTFKEMLSEAFKQAPMVEIQNEAFLPSYSHLVRCLDFVEDKPIEEKARIKHKVEDSRDRSDELDWMAKDAIITSSTTTPPSIVKDKQNEELASTWLWGFQAIHQWFKSLFTLRPETITSEEKQELMIELERENEKRKEQQRRVEFAYRRARQNFANFFHEMSKIVRKTCPAIHQPDKIFVRNALLDMATWGTLDQRETISTAALYFRKHELLKLLQECFRAL